MLTRRKVVVGIGSSAFFPLGSCKQPADSNNVVENNVANVAFEEVEKSAAELPFDVGRGISGSFGNVLAQIATGPTRKTFVTDESNYNPSNLRYFLVENQSKYNRILNRSASASGSLGIFSSSGRVSSTTVEGNNSYALHVMAIARRSNPLNMLDPSSVDLEPRAKAAVIRLSKAQEGQAELLKVYGDRYIMGIATGSDLLIDITFETSSSSKKKDLAAEIKGAISGLASGKGGYAELMESAKSQKNVSANIIGLDGTGVPKTFDANEVYDSLVDFFNDPNRPQVITKYDIRRFTDLVIEGERRNWVSERQFVIRSDFVTAVRSALETIDNAWIDASYVSANPDEFDSETIDRAARDKSTLKKARTLVEKRASASYAEFSDTGTTNPDTFDADFIQQAIPADLRSYPQRNPTSVVQPVPRARDLRSIRIQDVLVPHRQLFGQF